MCFEYIFSWRIQSLRLCVCEIRVCVWECQSTDVIKVLHLAVQIEKKTANILHQRTQENSHWNCFSETRSSKASIPEHINDERNICHLIAKVVEFINGKLPPLPIIEFAHYSKWPCQHPPHSHTNPTTHRVFFAPILWFLKLSGSWCPSFASIHAEKCASKSIRANWVEGNRRESK